MALSEAFVDDHIATWSAKLKSPFFPHRKHWPHHLFHHAPLENAVAILKDGCLRSRNDKDNSHPRDVAAPGVIDARSYAHDRVRLYFRPKTPTQYQIEGIRRKGECKFGDETHLPLLVMFCLDAKSVLLKPDIQFSNKNMQIASASVGSDQASFSAIPFDKVYHEGSTSDKSVFDARCAEVMPSSPLKLEECLHAILFRSHPEMETVLHRLGDDAEKWKPLCHVSDALKVFQKDYSFVSHLELTTEGLEFRLNPRRDHGTVRLRARVTDENDVASIDATYTAQPAKPKNGGNWIINKKHGQGDYEITVWIEDQIAYNGIQTLQADLI